MGQLSLCLTLWLAQKLVKNYLLLSPDERGVPLSPFPITWSGKEDKATFLHEGHREILIQYGACTEDVSRRPRSGLSLVNTPGGDALGGVLF